MLVQWSSPSDCQKVWFAHVRKIKTHLDFFFLSHSRFFLLIKFPVNIKLIYNTTLVSAPATIYSMFGQRESVQAYRRKGVHLGGRSLKFGQVRGKGLLVLWTFSRVVVVKLSCVPTRYTSFSMQLETKKTALLAIFNIKHFFLQLKNKNTVVELAWQTGKQTQSHACFCAQIHR